MSEQEDAKLLILGWTSNPEELQFLKQNEALKGIAPVIISPNLTAILRTALIREKSVVVLHPTTPADHEQVEEFLLKIDRKSKTNVPYVIVVSPQGKQFKSGVQSQAVIDEFEANAIARAVLHGIMVNTADEPAKLQADAQSGQSVQSLPSHQSEAEAQDGPHPVPSLLEYFKLPAFNKASPVLSTLSTDMRERIVVTLNEMNHSKLPVPEVADPLERAAVFLRQNHASEVAIVSSSEVLTFGPMCSQVLDQKVLPVSGEGVLEAGHPLFLILGVTADVRMRYAWVPELECCIVTWALDNEAAIFAQALLFSVLRIRKSDKFRVRKAA